MDVNVKYDLKEVMNASINNMIDCLALLDDGDIGATLTAWEGAIQGAKDVRLKMIRAKFNRENVQ